MSLGYGRVPAWLGVVVGAGLWACSSAQLNTGNMPDLGYPEPNWYPIVQGDAFTPAVIVNPNTQVWGTIEPFSTGPAPLCTWVDSTENGGRGSCLTDVSWIHSAVGLSKVLFDDAVVNYILRFQVEGACYRSTQYSDNDAAQYCASWWWDQGTNTKINTTHICYEITMTVFDELLQENVLLKHGCAHKAPVEGANLFAPVTLAAPPGATVTPGNTTTDATAAAPAATTTTTPVATTTTTPAATTTTTPAATTTTTPAAGTTAPAAGAVARKILEATATEPVSAEAPAVEELAADDAVDTDAAAPTTTAPATTPTANTAAPATGSGISTRDEFLAAAAVYNNEGLEFFEPRQVWYECHEFTVAGSEGRTQCYNEAFGKNFGLNADILKQMVYVMQQDIPQCSASFATNGGSQGTITNQAWCETNTANWIQDNVLPLYSITGTPAQPQSLEPTISSPPPPPPPDPPLPASNVAPITETDVVDDVFQPATPTDDTVDTESRAASSIAHFWGSVGASALAAWTLLLALM